MLHGTLEPYIYIYIYIYGKSDLIPASVHGGPDQRHTEPESPPSPEITTRWRLATDVKDYVW